MNTVDIIVPCYNYGRYLRQCVQSVLDQEGVHVRVLIIDDASPDDTPEVARSLVEADSRVSYRRHTLNARHIATYNEGLEWLSAEFALLLSADDFLQPGALQRAANMLSANPDLSFVFGSVVELGTDGSEVTSVPSLMGQLASLILSGREFITRSGSHNFVATPTAVVRTSIQRRVGGYRPELPHTGDMEMWLRLAARGGVGMLRSAQATWRKHDGNMSDAYATHSCLPELRQKQAAIEWFARSSMDSELNVEDLSKHMLRALGIEAIGRASSAFNVDALAQYQEILDFAVHVNPEVRSSWAWRKLQLKSMLGRRAWHTLMPAQRVIRGLTSRATNRQA